jgi:hypothetical protein
MSHVRTPGETGQSPVPAITTSVVTSEPDVLDNLAALRRGIEDIERNLPQLRAACEHLYARIAVERAAEEEERDAPGTTPDPPQVPGLALRSDGKTLLSITHLDGVDVSDREVWTGVVLSEAEGSDALERITDACDEAAGHVAGRILLMSKKRSDEPDDGDNE